MQQQQLLQVLNLREIVVSLLVAPEWAYPEGCSCSCEDPLGPVVGHARVHVVKGAGVAAQHSYLTVLLDVATNHQVRLDNRVNNRTRAACRSIIYL